MSKYKAKVGDKIKIVKVEEPYGKDKYKICDVMTVDRHGSLYLIAVDNEGIEHALSESEYEVITEEEKPLIDFEPEEIELTQTQLNAINDFLDGDPFDFISVLEYTHKQIWEVDRWKCLNELSVDQVATAILRPDKIKIKEEVKYEILNPVTAFEQFRDGVEICFKKEEDEEWFKLVEENTISVLIDDRYKLAVKVNG